MVSRRTRVLIAEDSAIAVRMITKIISKEPSFEIVDTVNNGRAACMSVSENRPDLILMDLNMPIMDGLEATKKIMGEYPTPILILTSKASVSKDFSPYQAIKLGAVDAMEKPDADFIINPANVKNFLMTLKTVSAVKVVRHISDRGSRRKQIVPASASNIRHAATSEAIRTASKESIDQELGSPLERLICDKEILAIASSTGGPKALHQILSRLPAHFPIPIVIVQHTLRGFMDELIGWLAKESPLKIDVAKNRSALEAGNVYFCPDSAYITIGKDQHIQLTTPERKPGEDLHILSGNSLLSSVAKVYGDRAIGVVLTGMGDDGALGLKHIKDAGGLTIAQDEATSAVFGMPKVAAEMNAATYLLPIGSIASMIIRITYCKHSGKKAR